MRSTKTTLLSAVLLLKCVLLAQEPAEKKTYGVAPPLRPAGDIEFKSALALKQKPTGLQPQLRGGSVAVSTQWPASFYVTFVTSEGRPAGCIAALIGPRVMLTAAHCVPDNGKVTMQFSGGKYETTCTQHPEFHKDASADHALCQLTKKFIPPAGFLYETVDTQEMDNHSNQAILLTGYGCIGNIVGGPSDGQYRIGPNRVDQTSSSLPKWRGEEYYAGHENNNLFTVDDPARSNLCPGDSGGPAFRLTPGSTDYTKRTIVGVNSRVFYANESHTVYGSSLISATGGPVFQSWAEKNGDACGIHGSVPNCRK